MSRETLRNNISADRPISERQNMGCELSAEVVQDILMDCLYKPEEITDGEAPEGCIEVQGIVQRFGLHPGRVEKHKDKIKEMLQELPEGFFKQTGGGCSFLQMCYDKHGRQWGEHMNMEALTVLAIAGGMGQYCLPKEMWGSLPGGMPYVQFDLEGAAELKSSATLVEE